MNLPQERDRVTVDGLGNIGQGKYTLPKKPVKSTKEPPAKINETMSENNPQRLANNVNRGIINQKSSSFHKQGDDPMFEVFGRAEESNPKELESLLKELSEMGVQINYNTSDGALAYQSIRIGEPGIISITPNASYSAYLHEAQHAKDDMRAGWNGSRAVWDVDEHIRREENAYQKEIDLALSLNRPDLADKLKLNLENEIKRIRKRDEQYARAFESFGNN